MTKVYPPYIGGYKRTLSLVTFTFIRCSSDNVTKLSLNCHLSLKPHKTTTKEKLL